MEQQVGPLGKPMSTTIKRSAQVSERIFYLFFARRRRESIVSTVLPGLLSVV